MPGSRLITATAMVALGASGCGDPAAHVADVDPRSATGETIAAAAPGPATSAVTHTGIPPHQPRPGRDRPVVAVIAHHDGAEVTDFVVPHGILARAEVAEVVALGTRPGPIEMFPALTIEPDATTAEFDRAYPDGADYVIVPAVHDPKAPALNEWIREQAARGATLVGVCDGVLVLANAGVLEGRRATGHWYSVGGLERKHPGTRWVKDRRYVADGNVITTTGVSASVPVSLALVEAIAGRARAEEVAASVGVEGWDAAHDSDAYGVTARHLLTWIGNLVAFWRGDSFGVEVVDGVDGVTLALLADAWSRTSRSEVLTVGGSDGPVRTRGGLRLIPDRRSGTGSPERMLGDLADLEAGSALDHALEGIARSYGAHTASFVALQLEYPWATGRSRSSPGATTGG